MFRLYILVAFFQAMVERSLQTRPMATCREVYARLQVRIRRRAVFHAANIGTKWLSFSVAANI